MTAIACPAEPGPFVVQTGARQYGGEFRGDPRLYGVYGAQADRHHSPLRGIAWEAMMVNSYYPIYQAERGKTAAEVRTAPDAG